MKSFAYRKLLLYAFLWVSFIGVFVIVQTYFDFRNLWTPSIKTPQYTIKQNVLDTIRVLLIGDSWAEYRYRMNCDAFFASIIREKTGRFAIVKSNGRGGAKSKDVYQLMYKETAGLSDVRPRYCTETLIRSGANYCVVFAGVNDISAKLGTTFYCKNMNLIIQQLLAGGICPILLEIPPLDLSSAHWYSLPRSWLVPLFTSIFVRSDTCTIESYNTAMYKMLKDSNLFNSIIYMPCSQWNTHGYKDPRALYDNDGLHLNSKGYKVLDSCIAEYIACDIKNIGFN